MQLEDRSTVVKDSMSCRKIACFLYLLMSVCLYFLDAFNKTWVQRHKIYTDLILRTLKYNISNGWNDISIDDAYDPDLKFFSKNVTNLDTVYVLPEGFHNSLEKPVTGYFSILHLNIQSIKKNFECFKKILSPLDFTFSIICFSETWCDDLDNFTYDLGNYISTHQKRSDSKGEGVSTYIHD